MTTNEPNSPSEDSATPVKSGGTITMAKSAFFALLFGAVVVTAVVVGTLTAVVTSDSDDSATRSTRSADSRSGGVTGTNSTATTTSEVALYEMNQPAINGSLKFSLLSAERVPSAVQYKSSDGNYGFVSVSPKQNAKFILLKASIENVGRVGFDTQNAVNISVGDDQDRFFRTVEDNYSLELNFGREELPDELQPGFSTDMYYLFEVPASATINVLAIADGDDRAPKFSYIVLRPNL